VVKIKDGVFLVTGGYGLVASHIADQLLNGGARDVRLLDNAAVGSAETVRHLDGNPRIRLLQGDILRPEDLMAALDGVEGVFHTAMFITLPLSKRPALGMDVNVKGVVNLLEACRWRGVKKIIYSSSISAYGNQTDERVTETAPYVIAGMHPASALYGLSKLMGEQLCAFYAGQGGPDWVSLRLSTVYGERQHARGLNVLPLVDAHDRVRRGLAPIVSGDGTDARDYVYVGDVARAQLMAMDSSVTGEIFTIASSQPSSYDDVVRKVMDACGVDFPIEHDIKTERIKSATVSGQRFDISKAEKLLNWRPEIDLKEGVRRFVAWRDSTLNA